MSGRNFAPGRDVRVTYRDPLGRLTGTSATSVVDEFGRFVLSFAACDPNQLPGPHQVRASAGPDTATATFTATT